MPLLWTFDSRDWLRDLEIPALVIAGSADPVVPVHHVRRVHEQLSDSFFLLVDGGGHVPSAEERPETAQAVRSFLAERRPA